MTNCENSSLQQPDKHLGGVTYGGYSESIVVDEAFVLRVSDKLNLAATGRCFVPASPRIPAAPLDVRQGQKVGVVGPRRLGHMGVKFADAFGARMVLFITSPNKTADAVRLGADEVVISENETEMQKHAGSFDFILDAVSAQHDLNAYINLLNLNGTLTLVGGVPQPTPVATIGLLFKQRQMAGSIIGGIRETQEILDFCAEHGVARDTELISVRQVDHAFDRLLKSDVKFDS